MPGSPGIGLHKGKIPRTGNITLDGKASEAKFPDREIFIDNPLNSTLFSRSVNMMAKRTLTPAEIGDIVRTTRKAAELRQDQLAGAAGVGLRFIVDLEAGKPTVQIGKTLQVLQALGCSFDVTTPPEPKHGRKA